MWLRSRKTSAQKKPLVVTGHQADLIKEVMEGRNLIYAFQEKQLGTAHAVLQAGDALRDFDGDVLILCGDVPLLLPSTIEDLLEKHRAGGTAITVMTAILNDPGSYGRIIKNEEGAVLKIVEARDANTEERAIKEINTGIYCAENAFLFEAVKKIDNKNAQGEYYLTDIFEIARRENRKTGSFIIDDPSEAMGINTADDLENRGKDYAKQEIGFADRSIPILFLILNPNFEIDFKKQSC